MNQFKILIVEDDKEFQKLMTSILGPYHLIEFCESLKETKLKLHASKPDLMLLDLNLPDGDGLSYFAELQSNEETQSIPVMIITANTDAEKEVMGFSLGAEDFIVKPVDPVRLKARIQNKVKQIQSREPNDIYFFKGTIKLCLSTQQAYLIRENRELAIELTPIEFKLLFQFLRHEEKTFSCEQLIMTVRGKSEMSDRTIDMHVSNLRKKIAETEFKIRPIHGVGYRISKFQSH